MLARERAQASPALLPAVRSGTVSATRERTSVGISAFNGEPSQYLNGRVVEVGVRFVRGFEVGDQQIQLFKRNRDGFYVLGRVNSNKGGFSVRDVEDLYGMTLGHIRIHLATTSGVQLVLPA
jgi:hypothetical protein